MNTIPKSSQGIVSKQDMDKLDVVAHQQQIQDAADKATATSSSSNNIIRSTAHMNVSGKGNRKRR